MDFNKVISSRRSIRSYKTDPIPESALAQITETVQQAPSACNLQPWEFRIIFNDKIREAICRVYTQKWLAEAPAIVVALGNSATAWKRLDGSSIIDMDIGIAMEHLVLAAAAEGLGTCWICAYDVKNMNQALEITAPWNALAISPLGYPAQQPGDISRKPADEIVKVVR